MKFYILLCSPSIVTAWILGFLYWWVFQQRSWGNRPKYPERTRKLVGGLVFIFQLISSLSSCCACGESGPYPFNAVSRHIPFAADIISIWEASWITQRRGYANIRTKTAIRKSFPSSSQSSPSSAHRSPRDTLRRKGYQLVRIWMGMFRRVSVLLGMAPAQILLWTILELLWTSAKAVCRSARDASGMILRFLWSLVLKKLWDILTMVWGWARGCCGGMFRFCWSMLKKLWNSLTMVWGWARGRRGTRGFWGRMALKARASRPSSGEFSRELARLPSPPPPPSTNQAN
jgi:hypothetical protein